MERGGGGGREGGREGEMYPRKAEIYNYNYRSNNTVTNRLTDLAAAAAATKIREIKVEEI